jgi:hypothetical protein
MPRHDADLYDYLATSLVSEVTVAQLEQSLENSFINKSNIEFWKGAITVHRLLEVSRTYPWGLPIPEKSTILTETTEASGTITIKPTGTEIWVLKAMLGQGIGGDAQTTVSYVTDTSTLAIKTGDTITAAGTRYDLNDKITAPIQLTSSMWLTIEETAGVNGLAVIAAYTVVGL